MLLNIRKENLIKSMNILYWLFSINPINNVATELKKDPKKMELSLKLYFLNLNIALFIGLNVFHH